MSGSVMKDAKTQHQRPPGWGARFTYTLFVFLGMALCYAVRVDMSVVIIAMVDRSSGDNIAYSGTQCLVNGTEEIEDDNPNNGVFDWNTEQQGLVLAGFSYGYCATQVLGGLLAMKYSAKMVFGISAGFSAMLGLLSPTMANIDIGALIALRALQGAFQGCTLSAMYVMTAKWLPRQEKARLFSLMQAGCQFGTFISLPGSSLVSHYFGWEYVFYISGSLGMVWFVLWMLLIHDSPKDHPRISKEEQEYIETNLLAAQKLPGQRLFPPLKQVFTSIPFIAVMIAHTGFNWGFYTMLTGTPLFLNNIHHFSLTNNGFLSTLPYMAMFFCSFPVGFLSDYLLNTGRLSAGSIRKIFNSMGSLGPAVGMVWLAYVGCNSTTAVVALVLSTALCSGGYAGFNMNHAELSPNYSGFLFSISNTFSSVPGFVAPIVMGALTNGNQTLEAWRTFYLMAAGFYSVGGLTFIVFGKSEAQAFDKVETLGANKIET